jgi:curved DNA-binding protein CbpA
LGYSIWWDPKIEPGKRFEQVILKALEESKAVVVIWTNTSIQSEWVYEEANYGRRKNILIPIYFDDCEAPLGFRGREGAKLMGATADDSEGEWEIFLKSLESLAGSPPSRASKIRPATGLIQFDLPSEQREFSTNSYDDRKIDRSGRGIDLRCDVAISLEEAFHGTEILVDVRHKGETKRLKCKIPRGIADGTRIRFAGEGGRGECNGDLYLFIAVAPHPVFERRENDLALKLPVDVATASLGGFVSVPTPDGEEDLVIHAGVQTGHKYTIPSKGMPILKQSERGDLLIEVFVETPVNLSEAGRNLMQKLKDELHK